MRILLAEDDRALSALLCDFFRAAGIAVRQAFDGADALAACRAEHFDLVVLDVMMPEYDGLAVCRTLREASDVPVIFITALGQERDAIAGFRAGADDYVVKPFSFPVLVAKAQALARRAAGLRPADGQLTYGSMVLDPRNRTVTVDGAPAPLRPKEYEILSMLLQNKGRIVSRDALIERIWGAEFGGDERMADRHIASLRHALGTAAQHIKTVYGQGYRVG